MTTCFWISIRPNPEVGKTVIQACLVHLDEDVIFWFSESPPRPKLRVQQTPEGAIHAGWRHSKGESERRRTDRPEIWSWSIRPIHSSRLGVAFCVSNHRARTKISAPVPAGRSSDSDEPFGWWCVVSLKRHSSIARRPGRTCKHVRCSRLPPHYFRGSIGPIAIAHALYLGPNLLTISLSKV